VVRIRMSRLGRPHRPFYRINAIEKTTKRDGKVLETLGWYNPVEKDETKQWHLDEERVKFWLASGAQPSDSMMDVLSKRSLVDAEAWKAVRATRVEGKKKSQAAAAAKAVETAKAESNKKAAKEAKKE
jgi:small subunit ribosomal protein S16